DSGFALYQNTPNPYAGQTVIGFKLPEASKATLSVYDVTGKVLKIVEGEYSEGYNEVALKSSDLSVTGVLYYQLDTKTYTATKKMIVIE
ncbi:T9SS type A sorting domain-containing protein, partial [Membranicola marinus]